MNKTAEAASFIIMILIACIGLGFSDAKDEEDILTKRLGLSAGLISRDSCIGVVNALVDGAVKDELNEKAHQKWIEVELPSVKKRIADGVRQLPDDGEIHYERM